MGAVLIPIDIQLRFFFFGLESALGVTFVASEMERVFSDAVEDQVSEKSYVFFGTSKPKVSGKVDAHEPETVWVSVDHRKWPDERLQELAEIARHHARRLRQDEP